jgi:hypothetical protein
VSRMAPPTQRDRGPAGGVDLQPGQVSMTFPAAPGIPGCCRLTSTDGLEVPAQAVAQPDASVELPAIALDATVGGAGVDRRHHAGPRASWSIHRFTVNGWPVSGDHATTNGLVAQPITSG